MGFTVLQWNSRSLFEKRHGFKNYLSTLMTYLMSSALMSCN